MGKALLSIATLSWVKVLIAGIILGAFYYFSFYNDGSAIEAVIDKTNQECKEAERQLKATREAITNADRFEREVKETVDQFNRGIVDIMPSRTTGADLTNLVSDISNKSGVRLTKTEPMNSLERGEFYEMTRLSISLEGTFSQITMFLSYLSRIPTLMNFDRMELSTNPGSDIETPRLTAKGVLTSYRYSPPTQASAGGGNAKK